MWREPTGRRPRRCDAIGGLNDVRFKSTAKQKGNLVNRITARVSAVSGDRECCAPAWSSGELDAEKSATSYLHEVPQAHAILAAQEYRRPEIPVPLLRG